MSAELPVLAFSEQPFAVLGVDALYELLRLRVDAFVVEQDCPYPELDGRDRHPDVRHLLGRGADGRLLAYCRLLPPGLAAFAAPSIGRVVVAADARGFRLADVLMAEAIARVRQRWPQLPIELGAQRHLEAFYRKHGFEAFSEPYLEDGIPHVDMRRPADAPLVPAIAQPRTVAVTAPIQCRHIDHIVLRIGELPGMLAFYRDVLGCSVERADERIGLYQLRAGRCLIDLVPVSGELGRAGGATPGLQGRNLDHVCLRVEPFDADAIIGWLDRHAVGHGAVETRYGAEGEGPSIYIEDPEGNRIELKGPPIP